MKPKTLLFFLMMVISFNSTAQSLLWGGRIGGKVYDTFLCQALDGQGNLVAAGIFSDTADLDYTASVSNYISNGGSDMFLCKVSSSGNIMWLKQFNTSGIINPSDMVLDASGNIYLAGSFRDTADFDPGAGQNILISNPSATYTDAFTSKYDMSGNLIWVKGIAGPYFDLSKSISVDATGNVYTCGTFINSCDIDPGPGVTTLTVNSFTGVFIQKLDAAGNFVWAKKLGQSAIMDVYKMKIDQAGNFYCIGDFQGTADFDPGAGTKLFVTQGSSQPDVFICKLNPSADFVWARQMGGDSLDRAQCADVDEDGNIYFAGLYQGVSDFDPDTTAVFNLYPFAPGSLAYYFGKLDSAGIFQWAYPLQLFNPTDILLSNNILYVAGYSWPMFDADPGPGTFTVTSSGMCIVALDPNSNFKNALFTGGGSSFFIDVDQASNVLISGSFSSGMDLSPGTASNIVTSAGGYDGMILKIAYLTGIETNHSTATLTAFPNPATNYTFINYELSMGQSGQLLLYNVLGKSIKRISINPGSNSLKLSTENIPAGTYYYFLKTESGITSINKLVIAK